ncbi:hypothetical protein OG818_18845 [Streptomyces virginiae]|uniref:hypothetical protein n=1 Tax=Streptomyces virginiae TaxID=1961 RepID=UPI00224F2248|nr:hypothetical protein [Streptomyces virginiae]MCX4717841.1 hypothetical protein [Streptomyces virginiae]
MTHSISRACFTSSISCAPARIAPRSGNTSRHARTTCASRERSVRPGTSSPDATVRPSRGQALAPERISGRLRRRVLAYRGIEFLSAHVPDPTGPGEECLLLVHIRKVVGQVRYRICPDCARGVVTAVVIDERFHSAGLGTRALSHLRSRHPTAAWRSTATRRTARDLLRRMRIPVITSGRSCDHMRRPLLDPMPATS